MRRHFALTFLRPNLWSLIRTGMKGRGVEATSERGLFYWLKGLGVC